MLLFPISTRHGTCTLCQVGPSIANGLCSCLQVGFAAKGTEFTAPPWMLREAIRSSGVDVFVDCAEVIVYINPQLVSGALQCFGRICTGALHAITQFGMLIKYGI